MVDYDRVRVLVISYDNYIFKFYVLPVTFLCKRLLQGFKVYIVFVFIVQERHIVLFSMQPWVMNSRFTKMHSRTATDNLWKTLLYLSMQQLRDLQCLNTM